MTPEKTSIPENDDRDVQERSQFSANQKLTFQSENIEKWEQESEKKKILVRIHDKHAR